MRTNKRARWMLRLRNSAGLFAALLIGCATILVASRCQDLSDRNRLPPVPIGSVPALEEWLGQN